MSLYRAYIYRNGQLASSGSCVSLETACAAADKYLGRIDCAGYVIGSRVKFDRYAESDAARVAVYSWGY